MWSKPESRCGLFSQAFSHSPTLQGTYLEGVVSADGGNTVDGSFAGRDYARLVRIDDQSKWTSPAVLHSKLVDSLR